MPMASTTTADLVMLRGGLTVPLPAVQLAWRLEGRGCYLRLAADGVGLLVGPRAYLTDDDRAAIRQHRAELLALIRYTGVM
jgi:hypothetical protein